MRRASFLIELTEQHRRVWSHLVREPSLARMLEDDPDLSGKPVTAAERMMVQFVILHIHSTLEAMRAGLAPRTESIDEDIRDFFSRPIPRGVWEEFRGLRNDRTGRRIDQLLGIE